MILTSHGRGNRTIRRTIGDPFERVCNAGQLEGNLVGSARSLQQHNPPTTEIERRPENHPDDQRYRRHENIVTRNGEASACDRNHEVREHVFLPVGLMIYRFRQGPLTLELRR